MARITRTTELHIPGFDTDENVLLMDLRALMAETMDYASDSQVLLFGQGTSQMRIQIVDSPRIVQEQQ